MNCYEPDALVDNGFATGGLAVDNDKAVVHRARLCPQGAQAPSQLWIKVQNPKSLDQCLFLARAWWVTSNRTGYLMCYIHRRLDVLPTLLAKPTDDRDRFG